MAGLDVRFAPLLGNCWTCKFQPKAVVGDPLELSCSREDQVSSFASPQDGISASLRELGLGTARLADRDKVVSHGSGNEIFHKHGFHIHLQYDFFNHKPAKVA